MIAIFIVGGLGLAGLVALAVYGVGLRHKAAAVQYEVGVVRERFAEVPDLISRLELPSKRA
ncbi:hypothetical protein [Tessaracoccus caeni]|uniref:hypothetical protein n=1 Tax=Tessaracoccus caeni TaxID=3031239 RepID=UPI0023DC6694|nr:hypothetical protein [Tessaracoccus caeni]MDF1488010.1 hypothetical protein [Tessaracoccus caeni]